MNGKSRRGPDADRLAGFLAAAYSRERHADARSRLRFRSSRENTAHQRTHSKNPIHYGWLVPKKSKEPRRADLTKTYPLQYGEDFPIVVTVDEFRKTNPELFKETATRPKTWGRHSLCPLPSNKVTCIVRNEQRVLATMTPNIPRDGLGKLSPRFSCQRCKPQHSIGMDDVYDAIGVKLKDVKIGEREH